MTIKIPQLLSFFKGLFLYFALALPMLGQLLSYNRLISTFFLICAAIIKISAPSGSLKKFTYGKQNSAKFLAFILLLLIITLHANERQLNLTLSGNYYEDKFTSLLLFYLYALVIAFLSIPRNQQDFNYCYKGITFAAILAGLFAIAISHETIIEYFYSDWQQRKQLTEDSLVSTINITIYFISSLFFSLYLYNRKNHFFYLLLAFLFLIPIIAYGQRSAWLYLVITFPLVFLKLSMKKFFTLIATNFLLLTIVLSQISTDSFISIYANNLIYGSGVNVRAELFANALQGLSVFGNGIGSYYLDFKQKYPHNIFFESFYEIGILGFIVFLYFYLSLFRKTIPLLLKRTLGIDTIFSLVTLYIALVLLKSSDLKSFSFLFVYIIFTLNTTKWIKK